jgi:hypothetical protein
MLLRRRWRTSVADTGSVDLHNTAPRHETSHPGRHGPLFRLSRPGYQRSSESRLVCEVLYRSSKYLVFMQRYNKMGLRSTGIPHRIINCCLPGLCYFNIWSMVV